MGVIPRTLFQNGATTWKTKCYIGGFLLSLQQYVAEEGTGKVNFLFYNSNDIWKYFI